ncbi:MAG: invasion associated locus B family protein [Rhizobium sp.]
MRFSSIAGPWVPRAVAAALLILPGFAIDAAAQTAPAQPPSATPAPSTPAPVPDSSPAPAPADPITPDAQPPKQSKTNFGAWTEVCGTPDGSADKKCVLMQSVVSQERPEMQISVAISKAPGGKTGLLRVQAPLSVLLPNGLGLYIDGNDIGNAYFARCFSDGCYAEVVLEDALLGTLRKGVTATFTVFQTQEEGIGIPVDLKGFADGYAALP